MRFTKGALWLICPLWTLLILGCTSKGSTRLCEGFESYETEQEVRNKIRQSGMAERWTEEAIRSRVTESQNPPLLLMSGPFKSQEMDGQMRLMFFDGRLMTAEFDPDNGPEYLAALKKRGVELPAKAATNITIDRRTKFRYDWSDGRLWVSWSDPKLRRELVKWKMSHD